MEEIFQRCWLLVELAKFWPIGEKGRATCPVGIWQSFYNVFQLNPMVFVVPIGGLRLEMNAAKTHAFYLQSL